jgi:hypothetical protein
MINNIVTQVVGNTGINSFQLDLNLYKWLFSGEFTFMHSDFPNSVHFYILFKIFRWDVFAYKDEWNFRVNITNFLIV